MIGSFQIWVSTPYFVLLTLNNSWYSDEDNPHAINISYADVVTDRRVNYGLVGYANIAENDLHIVFNINYSPQWLRLDLKYVRVRLHSIIEVW